MRTILIANLPHRALSFPFYASVILRCFSQNALQAAELTPSFYLYGRVTRRLEERHQAISFLQMDSFLLPADGRFERRESHR